MSTDLYQAIMVRKSVRRYQSNPVDNSFLANINSAISLVHPLVAQNRFSAIVMTTAPNENLVESLGGYGRLLNPPHYIVPSIEGTQRPLVDLGYRVEQVVLRITAMGLGSCYIGALDREDTSRQVFGLSSKARIGAVVIFGYPTEALGGKAVNRLMKVVSGSENKKPIRELLYVDNFDTPADPLPTIAKLIEAGRRAPSAANAQPWRFLWENGAHRLHLFVTKRSAKYMEGPRSEYRYYDGGICLANIAIAGQSLGINVNWQLHAPKTIDESRYPEALEPIAYCDLDV
jgi:nitroreductase